MIALSVQLLMALATLAIAKPTRKQFPSRGLATAPFPGPPDVEAAIRDWASDVDAVNDFLNAAPGMVSAGQLTDLDSKATSVAVNFAADERLQLQTLINWFDPTLPISNPNVSTAAFSCAINDLAVGTTITPDDATTGTTFNSKALVIDVFANIVSDANAGLDGAGSAQVDVVNSFRCCNVLPDLDIIWVDSAKSAGLDLASLPAPARPNACASIDCSGVSQHSTCSSLDNGSL